jgi:hypothetical protein
VVRLLRRFEAAQHFVIAVDEMHADVRAQLVRLDGAQMMAPAHAAHDIVNCRQGRQKAVFVCHTRRCGRAGASRRRPQDGVRVRYTSCAGQDVPTRGEQLRTRIIHDQYPG